MVVRISLQEYMTIWLFYYDNLVWMLDSRHNNIRNSYLLTFSAFNIRSIASFDISLSSFLVNKLGNLASQSGQIELGRISSESSIWAYWIYKHNQLNILNLLINLTLCKLCCYIPSCTRLCFKQSYNVFNTQALTRQVRQRTQANEDDVIE